MVKRFVSNFDGFVSLCPNMPMWNDHFEDHPPCKIGLVLDIGQWLFIENVILNDQPGISCLEKMTT